MNGDELKAFLQRTPLKPLEIELSTGERVEMKHPDLLMIGKRSQESESSKTKPATGTTTCSRWTYFTSLACAKKATQFLQRTAAEMRTHTEGVG
jgi:hypothetical protein